MLLATFCAIVPAQNPSGPAAPVRPGIEAFVSNVPERIRAKRVGLITNHAGIDRAGTSDIDLIAAHPDLKLVALFAAEHGIRGVSAAGEKVTDDRDAKTGLPIFSLYMAEDRGPTPEMLKDVDALVYDLPEVGGRTWTYVSTMALSMQAAARKKIPFVGTRPAEPHWRRDCRGCVARAGLQVVRRHVSHPGPPRDDRR